MAGGIGDSVQQIESVAAFAAIFAVLGYLTFDFVLEG